MPAFRVVSLRLAWIPSRATAQSICAFHCWWLCCYFVKGPTVEYSREIWQKSRSVLSRDWRYIFCWCCVPQPVRDTGQLKLGLWLWASTRMLQSGVPDDPRAVCVIEKQIGATLLLRWGG